MLLCLTLSCKEDKKVTPKQVNDITKEQTKDIPNLYIHEDKKIEKFQNVEIRLAIHDIEELIQDFCMNKSIAPTLKQVNAMIDDDQLQYENVPRTDFKGVEQLNLKDIKINELNLKYTQDGFECKGTMDIVIEKLKWKHSIKIPQGLTSFQLRRLINTGHSE